MCIKLQTSFCFQLNTTNSCVELQHLINFETTSKKVFAARLLVLGRIFLNTLAPPHVAESLLICEAMERAILRDVKISPDFPMSIPLTARWPWGELIPGPACGAEWIIISTYRSGPSLCPDHSTPGPAQRRPQTLCLKPSGAFYHSVSAPSEGPSPHQPALLVPEYKERTENKPIVLFLYFFMFFPKINYSVSLHEALHLFCLIRIIFTCLPVSKLRLIDGTHLAAEVKQYFQ